MPIARREHPPRTSWRVDAFGDGAVLVTLGETIDLDLNRRVHRLASVVSALRDEQPRLHRPVAGFATLLVPFDPIGLSVDEARSIIEPLIDGVLDEHLDDIEASFARRPIVTIPTRYGASDGPDLDTVAGWCGLSPTEVIELHSRVVYHVFMLGFAPGFAYLGPLPAALVVPRRPTPRERVPAGSVAIAGGQTAVYPFATPGGWNLIGRTEALLWDMDADPPSRLMAGDRVQFLPAE